MSGVTSQVPLMAVVDAFGNTLRYEPLATGAFIGTEFGGTGSSVGVDNSGVSITTDQITDLEKGNLTSTDSDITVTNGTNAVLGTGTSITFNTSGVEDAFTQSPDAVMDAGSDPSDW